MRSATVKYILEQRVFLCDTYVTYGAAGKWWKFWHKFHNEWLTRSQINKNSMNILWSTWLLMDKKQKHKRRVFTEEKLDVPGARFEHTPKKSMKLLAQETGETTPTKWLKFRPNKMTIVYDKKKREPPNRIHFCSCFLQSVAMVRSIRNWLSFLVKRGSTYRDT
jgi:hypothetical protein